MKNKFLVEILLILIITGGSTTIANAEDTFMDKEEYFRTVKQDIFSLMMAYPKEIIDVEKAESDKIYIITSSGKKILYDDMEEKNLNEKINNADLQDVMEAIYPLSFPVKLSEESFDPGRFRCYELLNELYGSSEAEVRKNLTNVPAPYSLYQFNKNNEAAQSLQDAMNELKEISKSNGKVATLVNNVNGTFNYRVISGTGKLSPHAYGIAIDIASNSNDYWKWASRAAGEARMLSYPKELVETFEKYNFVWGGKWGHFDILHFEYRPEIIVKAKYFGSKALNEKQWYSNIPISDENLKYINIINDKLGE